MKDLGIYKSRLDSRLKELEARLHKIEDELDNPKSTDWDERATESEGDETLEAMGLSGLQEIEMIKGALVRMEKGVYGICVQCEEPILEERLELLPATPWCRNCARQQG